jgi:hypothetical protein
MATLGQLLGEHTYLKLQPSNKILCSVTQHEMPARADVVLAHINGKKFKKALEWYNFDYSQFLPHIVEDRKDSKKLFCKLSRHSINKIPDEVKKHMAGKRFQRLLAEFEALEKKKALSKTGKKTHKEASEEGSGSDEEDDEDADGWVGS